MTEEDEGKELTEEPVNESIEIVELEDWDSFEREIEGDFLNIDKLKEETGECFSDLLFRGHADKKWKLETTLERYTEKKNCYWKEYSIREYWEILRSIKPSISSLTGNSIELSEFVDSTVMGTPPGYEFMIYTRHHGFPSPLLDWSASPYVAAFFAFNDVNEEDDIAIYSYLEDIGEGKSGWAADPQIVGLGAYAQTHRRHFQQQCQYTICVKKIEDDFRKRVYVSHEEVEFGHNQDILRKYVIPGRERKKVMRKLSLMNITAFSLFGGEESLMDMLAHQEIEGKNI